MAKEKKQASVTWIAFVHAIFSFIASIFLTLIFGIVLSVALIPVLGETNIDMFLDGTLGLLVLGALGVLLLWWAAANSAKMTIRKYVLADRKSLLLTSVIMFAVLELISDAVDFIFFGETPIWEHLTSLVAIGVFYLVSKKYFISS
jgi:hypothetical protein